MFDMKKHLKALAAILTILGFSSAAHASLIISGGTEGLNPVGSTNEVIEGQWAGIFGGQVSTASAGRFQFEFIGFEAGYHNWFQLDTGSGFSTIFDTENHASNQVGTMTNPIGTLFTVVLQAGTLDFRFVVNSGSGSVTNGSNGDDSAGLAGINFFLSMDDSYDRYGHSIVVFLDDAGAGPDDNHDDMVVRITRVPEPGTLALLGIGLIGLALTRRRKTS